jgi:hypothetical protein
MGGGHAKGSMASQHYSLQATNFIPFWLLFEAEAVPQEQIKHQSLHTAAEAPPCPSEAKEKTCWNKKGLKQ